CESQKLPARKLHSVHCLIRPHRPRGPNRKGDVCAMTFPLWVRRLGFQNPLVAELAGPPESQALIAGNFRLRLQSPFDQLQPSPQPRVRNSSSRLLSRFEMLGDGDPTAWLAM